MHRDGATTALPLAGPVLQRDHVSELTTGIGHHGPAEPRDFLRPESGFEGQQHHNPIAFRVAGFRDMIEQFRDMPRVDDLRLFAERHCLP
jgi:hypothetical protein